MVGLLRANTMGRLLKDAISRKISGVNTPPTAAAPVNGLLATNCTNEGDKLLFQLMMHFLSLMFHIVLCSLYCCSICLCRQTSSVAFDPPPAYTLQNIIQRQDL